MPFLGLIIQLLVTTVVIHTNMMQDNNNTASISTKAPFLSLFESLQYGELHLKQDVQANFFGIIAIHNTTRGPSLGGCRFIPYSEPQNAIIDALKLAQGMSYKAAISDLPLGGGKSVIIYSDKIKDRRKIFELFGDFVDSLGGRYITAEDSGTHVTDMDIIFERTAYVTGHSHIAFATHDPSPLTALGVVTGMQAAAQHHLQHSSLAGLHIAIQGVGNVGFRIAQLCQHYGAKVTVCDSNPKALQHAKEHLKVDICAVDQIHSIPCDIFAPCALGNAINTQTVHKVNAKIVAGAANNQLESIEMARILKQKGILYAPDYAINAGGLIHVAAQYLHQDEAQAREKVLKIYDTLQSIFTQSDTTGLSTAEIANQIAEQRLQA